jgi:hypothetical protein
MSGFGEGPGSDDGTELLKVVSATIGTDLSIPPEEREAYLRGQVQKMLEYKRAVADLLLQRLMVDGIEHNIQFEDIEALCSLEKTPRGRSATLMRQAMIELMLSLRRG